MSNESQTVAPSDSTHSKLQRMNAQWEAVLSKAQQRRVELEEELREVSGTATSDVFVNYSAFVIDKRI